MATGYTEIVAERDDVTFNEFVWRCARAFGSFVSQRDQSLSAEPRLKLQPDTAWDEQQLAAHRAALDRATSMSASEAQKHADSEYREVKRVYEEIEEARQQKLRRYEAMMAKVEAWSPPTPDHEGTKKFMLEQLRDSVRFDCSHETGSAKKKTGAQWREEQFASAKRDIEYHSKKIAEEIERTKQRNAWVAALIKSIGAPGEEP